MFDSEDLLMSVFGGLVMLMLVGLIYWVAESNVEYDIRTSCEKQGSFISDGNVYVCELRND